jgi:hypothetical protein
MMLKKRMAVGLLSGLTFGVTAANAQVAPALYGSGAYGANQPCPYQMRVGDGATNKIDSVDEVRKNLEREQAFLVATLRAKNKLKGTLDDAKDVISGTIATKYADFILEHIDGQRRCSDYKRYVINDPNDRPAPTAPAPTAPAPAEPAPEPPPSTVDVPKAKPGERSGHGKKTPAEREAARKALKKAQSGGNAGTSGPDASNPTPGSASRIPASVVEGIYIDRAPAGEVPDDGAQSDMIPVTGFTPSQWNEVCDRRRDGGVSQIVCSRSPYTSVRKRAGSDEDCRKALNTLMDRTKDYQALEAKETASNRKISRLEEELEYEKSLPVELRTTTKQTTEGGYCAVCEQAAQEARQRQQYAALAMAGVGAVDMFIDYRKAKDIAQYNSALGWATQPSPGSVAGPFLVAQGLAGYISGGTGLGTYGCATGINGAGNINGPMAQYPMYGANSNNPATMYPNGVYGVPQAGAMYNPGVGPWGPNGPYALNGTQGPILTGTGQIPYGAIIGTDAFGNRIYSQGGVPNQYIAPGSAPYGVPGQNGVIFGSPGQYGTGYNPYYNTGVPGYTTGNYQVPGVYNNGPYANGAYGNGALGVNPMALQNGVAQNTYAALQAEAAALNSRIGILTNSSSGYNQSMYGYTANNISGYNQYGAPIYNTNTTGPYLSGSLTIGGSYVSTPNYLGTSNSGVVISPATRKMGK